MLLHCIFCSQFNNKAIFYLLPWNIRSVRKQRKDKIRWHWNKTFLNNWWDVLVLGRGGGGEMREGKLSKKREQENACKWQGIDSISFLPGCFRKWYSLPKHHVSPNFYQTDREIQLTGGGWKENGKTVKSETDNGIEGITPINSLAHFKAVRCQRGQLYWDPRYVWHALPISMKNANLCLL